MAQELLNGPDIRPLVHQAFGKGVPQAMGGQMFKTHFIESIPDQSFSTARRQTPAALINEVGAPIDPLHSDGEKNHL